MKDLLKAGIAYFLMVFVAGFVLGIIRVLLIVPLTGVRYAELLEMPLMLVIIYYSARSIVIRFRNINRPKGYIYTGVISFLILITAELSLVFGLQGMTLSEYFASRDPVSGTAYLFSLIIFMLMPYMISRHRSV